MSTQMSVSTRRQLLFKRVPPTLIAGGIILVFYFLVALTAPFWAPYDYGKIMTGKPQSGPTARNLFGTDQLGRDIFSRVVLGARVDLSLALSATALGVILGGIIGLTIGYLGGWIDEVVMRVIDMIISIPPLILALLVLSGFGSSPLLLVITVGLTYAPRVVRTARAAALSVITEDFITAAKARGESVWSIVLNELLPNATGPLFVEFAIRSGFAVIMIGSLGFLGFGIKPPTPEWGLMISESRNAIFAAPWTVVFPAIVMAVLVMALNLTTEGLARVLGHGFQREAT